MNATSTPFGPDFVKELIPYMLQVFDDGTRKAYRMIWDIFMSFVIENWIAILVVLVLLLLVAFVRALAGRWGMLGSVLYNYLYFGILFVYGLVRSPESFVSDYFEIVCALILYPVCYFTVGVILDKLGVRRRF